MSHLAIKIEAILYLKGQPLTLTEIATFAECDRPTAEAALLELMADCAQRNSALEVVETNEGYTLQLRPAFAGLVDTLIPANLKVGALRTLAVVALKGPISQVDVVNLRGSGAYQHIPELVEQGFVRKRRQTNGRSYSLQVTDKFHRYFQIEKLPSIEPLMRQQNKADLPNQAISPSSSQP